MTSLSRLLGSPSTSTDLLMRILERPDLVTAVRALPGAVLGQLIDRIGLEDAGDLVALASTAQLERIFDDDLWRADRPGGDEAFQSERFVLWLRVMLEAGEDHLVRRLCELPQDLVALAVHRLVLVIDMDVLADVLSLAGDDAERIEGAFENSVVEEWEEFRLIARELDAWEDVWNALMSLDRDHHDRLRAILEQCCAMSTEYISGQGGLFQVLTSAEMLDSDVAAARDDRRAAEGFITPADARAFLDLAKRGGGGDERDPITRAYFRALAAPAPLPNPLPQAGEGTRSQVGEGIRFFPSLPLAGEGRAEGKPCESSRSPERAGVRPHVAAPLFEQSMRDLRQRDPERFSARVQELGYLVNVWIAGGAHEGRRPTPMEALELVLRACEAGMRMQLGAGPATAEQALAVLAQTPADTLFRRGFRA